jgi:hypothetical protein
VPEVSETIPELLRPRVDAAVAWVNETEDVEFKVTGILDAHDSLSETDELRLILCGGDRCEQRSFVVTGVADSWKVEPVLADAPELAGKPQAELDPPPGPRRRWIDEQLSRHVFVVLVFYRGFW